MQRELGNSQISCVRMIKMYIASLIITHKNAPKEMLDNISMMECETHEFYKDLLTKSNISEALILQTCNRFEIYISGKQDDIGIKQAIMSMTKKFGKTVKSYIEIKRHIEVIDHLFRVVSSIDSLIIGENQIQFQVKSTFKFALENKYIGQVLGLVFKKTISIGKKIRSETNISKGKVSISSAAVDLVRKHCQIEDQNILLIGTGKMAALLADYLSGIGYNCLTTLGRTQINIEKFSMKYGAIPSHVRDLEKEIEKADIIFSATSCPRTLVSKDLVSRVEKKKQKNRIFVDIAVPADIDPSVSEFESVSYFSIKDLKNIAEFNKIKRSNEIEKVRVILDQEIEYFSKKLQHLHIEVFIKKLNEYTEDIRKNELNKVMRLLGPVDPNVEGILDNFSKSMKKKLLHNFNCEARSDNLDSINVENIVNCLIGSKNVPKN